MSILVDEADRRRARQVHGAVEAHRRAQRAGRGGVHRPRHRQGVRPPARAQARFAATNGQLTEAGFSAQFAAVACNPPTDVPRQPQLRRDRGARRPQGGQWLAGLGDVQAFIQYSRQFTQPLTQTASMANVLQSGVASAERVFELLDAPEQSADPPAPSRPRSPTPVRGRCGSRTSRSATRRPPLIERAVARGRAGPDRRHRRPDRCRQDHAGQPAHAVLRPRPAGGSRRRRRHRDAAAQRLRSGRSAWCCRTPGCSAARSATTSPTAIPPPPTSRCSPRREGHLRRSLRPLPARRLRHGDRRRPRRPVAPARSSSSRSPAPSSPTPAILILDEATSSVDTRTEALMQRAMARCAPAARASSSPTGCRPSATPTPSW
jgi:ATP-binding cassette subfamily B multidrug efflux pump